MRSRTWSEGRPWPLPCPRSGRAEGSPCIETPDLDVDLLVDGNLTLHGILITNERQRLVRLANLLAQRVIRPHVAHVLPLSHAAEAHRLVQSQHSGGKVVLAVREQLDSLTAQVRAVARR